MKNRLIVFSVIFLLLLTVLFISIFLDVSRWITAAIILTEFLFVVLIAGTAARYLNQVFQESNAALNIYEKDGSLSFWDKFGRIRSNLKEINSRTQRVAGMITNLTNPEDINVENNLPEQDPVRKALTEIKLVMKKIKDEDNQRSWVAEGLAQFSATLRNKGEIKEQASRIISSLVKYLNANQGGLYFEYVSEEGDRYLELMASYAYGKKKFVEGRVFEGQGILGQCMLERDFVFLTDIPPGYVKITSGLGEATPRNIVVVPLIFNDTFCGAIELAFFEVMPPHKVEFLKKVAEDIASEVISIRNYERTSKLLEASNTLTVELQSREEEMKQSLEELAATQEEMLRKQIELSGIIHAIDSTLATAELDTEGRIIKHNIILEQFLGYNNEELQQRNFNLIVGTSDRDFGWSNILDGTVKSGDFKTHSKSGLEVWLSITFTPIKDSANRVIRFLCMIQDITQKRTREKEFERLSLVADNTDNSVIITAADGLIEYVNEGFTKMTGYSAQEVIGRKPGKILQGPLTDTKTIDKLREQLKLGNSIYEEILNYNKSGQSYWVSLAINPVRDENGVITKYISIQADITQTKIKSLDFHQKMQALSRSNAIMEIDMSGCLIDINQNYLDVLGYNKDELIGKPYSILTKKENTFHKLVNTIAENGMQSGVFSRYDSKGGKHCMKLMDYPVLNLLGEIEKIIEFGVDVSNEKRLELEAQRRQSELTSYLNGINNTVASAEFDIQGKFVNANDIFLKVMGFTLEDLERKSFDYLMGDDPAVVMMWENLRLGRFFSGEFRMRNKQAKELWLTGTFNPITIGGESPEKILMFAQFTTQEKEKLNDLNAMVHALKSTLPVLEFTADFHCKTANERALKIFGLSRLGVRSKTILDFIAPNYHAIWNKERGEILMKDFVSACLPIVSEGVILQYEVSFSVHRHLDGSVAKVIVLLVREMNDRVPLLAIV